MNNTHELFNLFENQYEEISTEILKCRKHGYNVDIIFNRIIKSILKDNHTKILKNYKDDYFWDKNTGIFLKRIKLKDCKDEQGKDIKKYNLINDKTSELYTIYFYGYENYEKGIEINAYKELLRLLDEVEKESEFIYNQEMMLKSVRDLEDIIVKCESYIKNHELLGNIPTELHSIIAKTTKVIREIYSDNILLLLDRFDRFYDIVKKERESYEVSKYNYLEKKGLYNSISETLDNAAKKIIKDTYELHNENLNKGWTDGKSILSKGILEIRNNINIRESLNEISRTDYIKILRHKIKAETPEIEEYAREGLYLKVSEQENVLYEMVATVISIDNTKIYEIDLDNKIYMDEETIKTSVYKDLKINKSGKILKVVDDNIKIQILPIDVRCKKYIEESGIVVYSIKNEEQVVYMSQKSFEDFIKTIEYFKDKILEDKNETL